MQLELSGAEIAAAGTAVGSVLTVVTTKYIPIFGRLFSRNGNGNGKGEYLSKADHESLCVLKMDLIKTELANIKEHEAEAFKRLDKLEEKLDDRFDAILTAIHSRN